jgi:glyoxylase-like metal-dependent hydrolase (beta-lactamase superfamily II)
LLVDTGMGFVPIRPIVERLTSLPVHVINTHSHLDHTGGKHEFASIAAFDTLLARRRQ